MIAGEKKHKGTIDIMRIAFDITAVGTSYARMESGMGSYSMMYMPEQVTFLSDPDAEQMDNIYTI